MAVRMVGVRADLTAVRRGAEMVVAKVASLAGG
jgi:hypothetical protein